MTLTAHTAPTLTTSSDLVSALRAAGLDGRGGAGFSTATKIEQAITHRSALIVNGCDGEIGAAKDAAVLTHHLADVQHAIGLIDPPSVRFAVHRGSPLQARLAAAGLDVLDVPRRYVSSEASALVSLAAGGQARPLTKRTRLVAGGLDPTGRRLPATLVLNAETLLRIAQIATHGPGWFRSIGTLDEPGPRLVTISGAAQRPGVYESAAGTRLTQVLAPAGPSAAPVLAGGLAGGWIRAHEVPEAIWSRAELRARGADLGAGTLFVLPPQACPLAHTAELTRYAAGESAGQCGPCMFGLPAVATDLEHLLRGDRVAAERLWRRVGQLSGRGACHFPDGVARLLTSTLTTFADVVGDHLHRTCPLEHP